jgi:hypothetical protein
MSMLAFSKVERRAMFKNLQILKSKFHICHSIGFHFPSFVALCAFRYARGGESGEEQLAEGVTASWPRTSWQLAVNGEVKERLSATEQLLERTGRSLKYCQRLQCVF